MIVDVRPNNSPSMAESLSRSASSAGSDSVLASAFSNAANESWRVKKPRFARASHAGHPEPVDRGFRLGVGCRPCGFVEGVRGRFAWAKLFSFNLQERGRGTVLRRHGCLGSRGADDDSRTDEECELPNSGFQHHP